MAGLYLLGFLACVVPLMASSQPPLPPLLLLTETCYYPLNMTYVEKQLFNLNITYSLVGKEDTCDNPQKLQHVLSTAASGRLVMASLRAEVCESAKQLAGYFNSTLRLWNCPGSSGDREFTQQIPKISEIAKAFARVVFDMKWKSVGIITTEVIDMGSPRN